MGGFLDKRVKQAIEQSDYTIIPTTSDKLDMQGAISTIGEIKDITKNIIVVVNKVEKDEDFE
jgi:cellulose biosynthesis protein BcsQ